MAEDKQINELTATAVGLGAIIGAGIFVLSGTALSLAGSHAILAFIAVGIIAIIIGLELGELGSIIPGAKGGAYSYVHGAFGSELSFITGIILYFSYATGISVISLGFGAYLASLLGMAAGYQVPFAIVLIIFLCLVNMLGIKKAASADAYLVVIKILVLLVLVGFAMYLAFFQGHYRPGNFQMSAVQGGIGPLFEASIAIFFAYTGFQSISAFTSNVKGGPRSAARAILLAIGVSVFLYVLVAFAMILLFPSASFTITADPLATVLSYASAPDWLIVLVDLGAIIATMSATLALILTASRMVYQISSDGLLPRLFRSYDKKKDVASSGVVASGIIGIVMLFSGNIYTIAAISNFGLLFAFLMASLALLHFRRIKTRALFKAPLYPYLSVFAIVAILVLITGMPQVAIAIGVIMVLSLLVIYYSLREVEMKKVVRIRLFD